jgi:hypothetical protein
LGYVAVVSDAIDGVDSVASVNLSVVAYYGSRLAASSAALSYEWESVPIISELKVIAPICWGD